MSQDWKPHVSFGGLVTSLSLKMRKRTEADLVEAGLAHISFPRFWVMNALSVGPKSQAELCRLLVQRAPSMMEMLRRLESDGLTRYTQSETDARRKTWALTAKGRREHLRAREIIRDVGRRIDAFFVDYGVSEVELTRIKQILSELCSRDLQ
jgi:DNA-binding MarR family transcriptional regulator